MSTGAIIVIVIVLAAAAVVAAAELRRARMRRQFGPEYDRMAKELGRRKADAELAARAHGSPGRRHPGHLPRPGRSQSR